MEIGQRVTGEAVPGETVDPRPDKRPAHRSGDRNEDRFIVKQGSRLREERIALLGDLRIAGGVEKLVDIRVANRRDLAPELAEIPGG